MDTCKLLSQWQQPRGGDTLMKHTFIAMLMMGVAITTACTKTIYIPTEPRHTEVVTLKDTIVEIVTPGESHSRYTADTTSTLHSHSATSTATISNGTLSHTLVTHPRRDSIALQVREVHILDSIPYALPSCAKETKSTPMHTHAIATTIILTALIVLFATHLHRDKV